MSWAEAFHAAGVRVAPRDLLIGYGATGRMLTNAVQGGHLIRARRDHYMLPSEPQNLVAAVRVGGRLDCVSALAADELFAFEASWAHIRLEHEMSRLRSPRSRFLPLNGTTRDGVVLHWWPTTNESDANKYSVSREDALISALRCQHPWHALAAIDNAIHQKKLTLFAARMLFERLPDRVQFLRERIDGRAEAGQETVLRMIVLEARLDFDLQVTVPEVGRVDLIVEGCLALEADSRLAHDGWEHHVADRHRDLVLGREGYMSLRPAYQHTMFEPDLVRASILGLLDQNRHYRRSFS
jgi:very-short-patch-repair endonuclease